jgi:hypothetical protein
MTTSCNSTSSSTLQFPYSHKLNHRIIVAPFIEKGSDIKVKGLYFYSVTLFYLEVYINVHNFVHIKVHKC